tara:strand:- start:54 stop:1055 length:1002 start_codon:yes stop_codon:yes gene_type:complete
MSSKIVIKGKGKSHLIRSKVLLSPLAGVTDKTFRKLVRKWAPESLLFTEMVNATSLNKGYGKEKINQISSEDGPIGIQLFDNRPDAIAEAAIEAECSGAFLIDINMGCPVKKIAKKGGGSALLKNPKLAIELVKKISSAVNIPVTVKTRIGWSNKDKNIEEFGLRLQDAGANLVTIHGRTREQGFSGKADWEIIRKLKNKLEIPVIANGDIRSGEDAIKCLKITNADGVMIGRGVLGAPWIVGEIHSFIEGYDNFKKPNIHEKLQLIVEHLEELISAKGNHGLLIARKHISWTCKNFIGADKLRNTLIRAKSAQEIKYLINQAKESLKINSNM